MSVRVLAGDCRTLLPTLVARSVQCCVTSPPYFGLRDYGHAGQIGLEPTPDAYVAEMVAVFREVRRVLRDDGTLWLNLGDSYASGGGNGAQGASGQRADRRHTASVASRKGNGAAKPKDLLMIPAMVALGLRTDGWFLRSEIIWHKPNPMPESITDRPTSAHEKVFLLSKSRSYFYDAAAIAEPSCADGDRPQTRRAKELAAQHGLTAAHIDALRACGVSDAGKAKVTQSGFGRNGAEVMRLAAEAKVALGGYTREFLIADTRNARNVWTIATQPYSGAHFATMPPELAERCIKAGSKPGDTVLDPFGGAGTTGMVTDRLQRSAVLIELSQAHHALASSRIADDAPMFAQVTAA